MRTTAKEHFVEEEEKAVMNLMIHYQVIFYGVDVEEDDRKKVISLSHQHYSSESHYNFYPGNNYWPTDSCASCYKDLPALQGPQQ